VGRQQRQAVDQSLATDDGAAYPIPPDPGVAEATEPVRVDLPPLARIDDRHALAHQDQGGDGHDEAQALQRLGVPQLGGLPLEPAGLVVQKALLDAEAQPVFAEGLGVRQLVADDDPRLLGPLGYDNDSFISRP